MTSPEIQNIVADFMKFYDGRLTFPGWRNHVDAVKQEMLGDRFRLSQTVYSLKQKIVGLKYRQKVFEQDMNDPYVAALLRAKRNPDFGPRGYPFFQKDLKDIEEEMYRGSPEDVPREIRNMHMRQEFLIQLRKLENPVIRHFVLLCCTFAPQSIWYQHFSQGHPFATIQVLFDVFDFL